jgi:cytochrome c oxidase cbb3-type subunit 2
MNRNTRGIAGAASVAAALLVLARAPLAQDPGTAPPGAPPAAEPAPASPNATQPAQPTPAEPAAEAAPARAPAPPPAAAVARGEKTFDRYCVSCHGVEGDGDGPSAQWLDPRPRVLTSGIFKFRSTPSGDLPTDADLYRTITQGLHGTYMPRWQAITELERRDVVQYVKTLSPRFATEPQGRPIAIPPHPPLTAELARRGHEVWDQMQCAACHGERGKGDGSSASTLRDDWGYPVRPHDFTHGPLKVGDAPEDLYRTFMTGLNGSPMPSFAESITPEQAWALVAYVRTLRRD